MSDYMLTCSDYDNMLSILRGAGYEVEEADYGYDHYILRAVPSLACYGRKTYEYEFDETGKFMGLWDYDENAEESDGR